MILVAIAMNVLQVFAHSATSRTTESCVDHANLILTSHQSATDQLIAYLENLASAHVIDNVELSRFIEALGHERVINPISDEDAELDSKKLIHREGLEKIIVLGGLDFNRLEEWTRHTLEARGVVQIKREEAREQTQDTHQKIEFAPIKPGKFRMGEKGKKISVTLTHPFEVMTTPLTQKQWFDLMGKNPSKFVQGSTTISVQVRGKRIKMQPDHPVEQVTWWSAIVYLNRLSEKHGLPPAYDLSQITFKKGTKAETGTLDIIEGELKINAPNGNIYEAQGFRLPTEAEQEYLLRGGGRSNGQYSFGDDESNIDEYSWSKVNSNQTTHPVASLKPTLIDGKEIYDLHGNVAEWGQDWHSPLNRNAQTDPTGPATGQTKSIRGGDWGSFFDYHRSAFRGNIPPNNIYDHVGFRAVRTLR